MRAFIKIMLGGILGALLLAAPAGAGSMSDAAIAFKSGNYDKAISLYTKIIESKEFSGRDLSIVYFNRGVSWGKKGNDDRALADYNKAIEIFPRESDYYCNRGNIWDERGDRKRAMADFDKAIELNPSDPELYNNRGVVWRKMGNLDRAMADYNKAIELNPRQAKVFNNRGVVWKRKGEFRRARADFQMALKLDPELNTARNNLAEVEKLLVPDPPPADRDDPLSLGAPSSADQLPIMRLPATPSAPAPAAQAPATVAPSPPESGPRLALVIGNGDYSKMRRLHNPGNDARAMAKALRGLGFEVTSLENVGDRTEMMRAVKDFTKRLRQSKGVGLFYFSGHGLQCKGQNYFMPVNAVVDSEADVEYEAMDLGYVLAQMEAAGNPLNLVILDACRNNPLPASARSGGRGLAPLHHYPSGIFIAFATAPDSEAQDGQPGGLGLYTAALVQNMQTPGLRLEDVFIRVRQEVRRKSGGRQIPWEHSSVEGAFYFKR